MIDYVWDYGSLSREDERAYIGRMVQRITGNSDNLLADLLCTSQQCIREVDENHYCVSLRDAHRCIVLVKWFEKILQKRENLPLSSNSGQCESHGIARETTSEERAFVLALAHCYQSRLSTAEDRQGYRRRVCDCFEKHGRHHILQASFKAIVRAEQEDYLKRMEMAEGTAQNAALRENIFVMLVCILNRIPVFVVGKPGCSKSLSMQIIRSNLRGKDAKDPFLKSLPQLYVISHQGSESSTSDGILKVFDKARKYREHNKSDNVLPVVLLDEIGLAEVSKYNPLKVLHSLLEPSDGAFPDVSVVGISNWALDAAKINRAIHLSRPDPDVNDLTETGKSLRQVNSDSNAQYTAQTYPHDIDLRKLAEAYHRYQVSQRYANFHGLRDYYSLIKCLSSNTNHDTSTNLLHALRRNFGGVPTDVSIFEKVTESLQLNGEKCRFPVTQLIHDNLHDKLARHLMIITNGDSAIGILDQTFQSMDKEKITIFGSRFEEDLCEDYNYRMLSRIILCMERDCVLILRDLESIYGSLYDMLNQNYTVVGGRKNCRVALGAFSNPMCQVHDGFRCIVLIDERKVDYTDPPFLNRFEKQLLRFSDVLDDKEKDIIGTLNKWVKDICTIPDFESQFHEEDMFLGFCDDTLPSLVLKQCQDEEPKEEVVLEKCKQDLMLVATPDGFVRSLESSLAKSNFEEVQTLYNSYFQKPLHNGLEEYLKKSLENTQVNSKSGDANSGMRLLIMTHSNIHVNVTECLQGLLKCQTEKLSAFKSEKNLTKTLESFWRSNDTLLVLQCKPELDATHLLLAISIIEHQRQTQIREALQTENWQIKHVCIVIHVQRESKGDELESQRWQFSFQSGWKQVTIDTLEPLRLPITECLDVSVVDLLETKLSFTEVASDQFLWCFTRIRYPANRQPSVEDIVQLEQNLRSSSNSKILECFRELVKRWLNERDRNSRQLNARSWQFFVACDRQALIASSHLVGAIQHHVSHLVRQPLAKIVYFLEKESAWPKCLFKQKLSHEEELQVWSEVILNQEILNIDDIPYHQGAESYFVCERHLELRLPFASIFCNKVEQFQPLFAEDHRQLLLDTTNLDENEELSDTASELLIYKFSRRLRDKVPQLVELEYLHKNIGWYVEDLFDMKTGRFSNALSRDERVQFLKSAMAHHIKFSMDGDPSRVIAQLHSLFWLNESSYMTALQVYETCCYIEHVEFGKVYHTFTPVFEEMLFQDKRPHKKCLDGNKTLKQSYDELGESERVQAANVKFNEEEEGQVDKTTRPVDQHREQHENAQTKANEEPEEQKKQLPFAPTDNLRKGCFSNHRMGDSDDISDEKKIKSFQEGKFSDAAEGGRCEEALKSVLPEIEDYARKERNDRSLQQENHVEHRGNFEEIYSIAKEESDEEVEECSGDEGDSNEEDTESELQVNDIQDEAYGEKSIGFNEVLVKTLCSALFPTSDVIRSLNGYEGWQRTTTLFLSTVSRMQVQSPAYHFLRVCHDFATLVALSESLRQRYLYPLGELGKTGASEDYLSSQPVFEHVMNATDELKKEKNPPKALEDFIMLFYGRCIDSDLDTPWLFSILKRICCSEHKSYMELAGPLIHRIFLSEERIFPGVFEKLLHNLDSISEHPGLQVSSCALTSLPHDNKLDSPFAVVCCDLINEVGFLDIDFTTVVSSDDQPLLNFRRAFQTLTEPRENVNNRVFHLLCAAAYLKSFLASFCKFILQSPSYLEEDGKFSILLNEINAAFALNRTHQEHPTMGELQIYFLKEMRKELSMYEVCDRCGRSCKLPELRSIKGEEENLVGKLSSDPFQSLAEESQSQLALAALLEKRSLNPLENAISSLPNSVEKKVEMATVLAKSFYLIRSRRKLSDSEDKAISSFIVKFMNMETPYVELLLGITGQKDFNATGLCISPESSPADVQRAALILHLCIILASSFRSPGETKLAMMSYFVNPKASVDSYVLASGQCHVQPFSKHQNYVDLKLPKTTSTCCPCGMFFVVVDDGEKASCPSCEQNFKAGEIFIPKQMTQETTSPSKGYVVLINSGNISLCVRRLKPPEFRILNLFVHAALYGGYALGLIDESSLCNFMNTDHQDSSPSDLCFENISNDLKALCSLLNAKEEEIISFLHGVLDESASILTSVIVCHSLKERMSWEEEFASKFKPLLREFHPRKLLERTRRALENSLSPVQGKIEETDQPHFPSTEEGKMHVPRLLRVTLPKTFNGLKAFYMAAEDEEREKYPLLGLFLDFNDSLPLVAHLVPLVSWSRVVDSLLSRRLSRSDASTNVHDVIRSKTKTLEERNRLTETFKKFIDAFEAINPLLKEQLNQDVPHLSESSPISTCLVEKRGEGEFLCAAMETLQKIQNEFLQKVLSIAATGKSSALIFLKKDEGKCAIPIVPLQEAREKEVIRYPSEWSDDLLRYSHRNTEYGHGKEVCFDLARMEKELATRFLVGKAFLSTSDGLREFIFSRELFHTCKGILDELHKLIPQQPLKDMLRMRLSEHSLECVRELLEHMEIVLCLLKRHRIGKPDERLTEFTDKWFCGLRPFPKESLPEPHHEIQLMHVVALYEFLEDLLAESAAKRVHDMYRSPIPRHIKDKLAKTAILSGKSEADALNAITTALRRFIFRYLYSEKIRPEPGKCLAERMKESSLWPIDMYKSWESTEGESLVKFTQSTFPENLTIGHTYETLCLFQKRLRELEEAKQMSRCSVSKGGKTSVQRSRQLKGLPRFSLS
ncbi:uncharacterized protein LOC111339729 [Stylophora pistillata]|nr:uncharacterized protein LOC111339729 [Stylophora pistillata]